MGIAIHTTIHGISRSPTANSLKTILANIVLMGPRKPAIDAPNASPVLPTCSAAWLVLARLMANMVVSTKKALFL